MRWGAVRLTESAKQIGARSAERSNVTAFLNSRLGGAPKCSRSSAARGIDLLGRACRRWRRDCRVRLRHRPTTRVWAAMDGGVGEVVREAIGNAGIVPMREVWDSGFRQIT